MLFTFVINSPRHANKLVELNTRERETQHKDYMVNIPII